MRLILARTIVILLLLASAIMAILVAIHFVKFCWNHPKGVLIVVGMFAYFGAIMWAFDTIKEHEDL